MFEFLNLNSFLLKICSIELWVFLRYFLTRFSFKKHLYRYEIQFSYFKHKIKTILLYKTPTPVIVYISDKTNDTLSI